jgi:hypothetical protein
VLRLSDELRARLDGLEPEVRGGAEALGIAAAAELARLAPGLTRPEAGAPPDATLVALDLEHEGAPDGASLAACMAAHAAYVRRRGAPEGVSAGALALTRLLVWTQRAAMLGAPARLAWIGPSARAGAPGPGRHVLTARCALEMGGRVRRAEATAHLEGTPEDAAAEG